MRHWLRRAKPLAIKFMVNSEAMTCGGCGAEEGALHDLYCDMERCPFCGGQLSSCGCANKHFYPTYDPRMNNSFDFVVQFAGLPEDVYENGLPQEQLLKWEKILEEKGRIPYISYPVICQRCGALWPEFFRVSDEEWAHYIEPAMRRFVICRPCYDFIKVVIDKGERNV